MTEEPQGCTLEKTPEMENKSHALLQTGQVRQVSQRERTQATSQGTGGLLRSSHREQLI
jgi:hypothetical protein